MISLYLPGQVIIDPQSKIFYQFHPSDLNFISCNHKWGSFWFNFLIFDFLGGTYNQKFTLDCIKTEFVTF